MGRRQRFDLYERKGWGEEKGYLQKEQYKLLTDAEKFKYKRSRTHKALNAILQGSAADLMKRAMKTAYDNHLFTVLTPHITVHDELGVSVPKTKEGQEAFRELVNVMETCMPLNVPVLASAKIAANWNEAK
jgi:DNA polymerase-1